MRRAIMIVMILMRIFITLVILGVDAS